MSVTAPFPRLGVIMSKHCNKVRTVLYRLYSLILVPGPSEQSSEPFKRTVERDLGQHCFSALLAVTEARLRAFFMVHHPNGQQE